MLSFCLAAGHAAPGAPGMPGAKTQVHIGYVYPAGGCTGTTFEIKIGGENILGSRQCIVSGQGVTAQVTEPGIPLTDEERKKKRRNKSVIDEVVVARITISGDATPGNRQICLVAPEGLSDKLVFQIGQLREVREAEPNDKKEKATSVSDLPATLNGQLLSGDTDKFKFKARRGQHLVLQTSARALIPYVADAVPGWCEPVVALSDEAGREVAYSDSFLSSQDPVLFFNVPADGQYELTVHDSIYRGRADFVYRIAAGELPFITSVFPLGARQDDQPTAVSVSGWNLPTNALSVTVTQAAPAIAQITIWKGGLLSPPVPFAIGDLPEIVVAGQENRDPAGMVVSLPVIVNGRIGAPGEQHVYRFGGKKGQTVCMDVQARRLGSPFDSKLALLDAAGKVIAQNDDVKDRGQGLLTHQADSQIVKELPEDGMYAVAISDTQGKGGDAYGYRLRMAPATPDFELRSTPAALCVPKGGSAVFTVHAIRREGFNGDIRLSLDGVPPNAFTLDGGSLPAGTDKIRLTVSSTGEGNAGLCAPRLVGTATVNGNVISRPVVPAQEWMQAFAYQHLVPAGDLLVMTETSSVPFTVTAELPPSGVLDLPVGKETSFRIHATRAPGYNGPIRLQLEDPPKGIVFRGGGFGPRKTTSSATIRVESKIENRPRENLILTGIMQWKTEPPPPRPPSSNETAKALAIATNATPAAGTTNPVTTAAVSPKKPAGGPGNAAERTVVALAAIPFRVVENLQAKKTDSQKSGAATNAVQARASSGTGTNAPARGPAGRKPAK